MPNAGQSGGRCVDLKRRRLSAKWVSAIFPYLVAAVVP
jgi:hypothetical protein